jgi:hypothetical protein
LAALCGLLAAGARSPALSVCLPADGRFELHYVHSVERTPVVERYRVAADGSLWVEGMRFRSAGWGLPAQGYRRRGGWFETTDPPRRLENWVVRVSRMGRQEVRAGGRVLRLYPHLPEGAALRVRVRPADRCPRALVLELVR